MSSSTHHYATFTWPPTNSERVVVTGTFDSWSGDKHVLQRDPETGYFSTTVPVPYGDKVAYKYVVDGQWMTREDEAREWDSAGNMNNVYTAPHAPKIAEPTPATSASQTQPRAEPTSAVPATSTVPSSSVPTETRRSIDDQSSRTASAATPTPATASHPPPAPASTDNASPTSEKKHGLAGLAANAASAIGLSKGSHQASTASASRQTDGVPPAQSGHLSSQTGDHAPLASTHADAAASQSTKSARSVEEVKTKAENLVASSVPSSTTASRHVDSTSSPVARAPQTTESSVAQTTTSLSGLNLGAPIGAASSAYSPTHTTTTSATGTSNLTSTTEKPKEFITEPKTTRTAVSDETAVAPKTEGPKTAIPQPAVVVPGAAPTAGAFSKSVSPETAAAPVDDGPRTSIPHPTVEGATGTSASPLSANIPTGGVNAAPISETVTTQAEKLAHAAEQVGTSALAALTSAASGLVIGVGDAVHAVTGVDIVHRDPVSLHSSPPKVLSDLEEGRGDDKKNERKLEVAALEAAKRERDGPATAMAVPFESQLKRSPRLAQTGFPLPAPASASPLSGTTTMPFMRRAPSSSGSLYKSEAQELRRRSWNLNNDQQSPQPQITIEEAKRAGINSKDLPILENGPPSARSAEALANTLTAPIPIAKDTAAQASSTARDFTSNTLNQGAATHTPVFPAKTTAPAPVQPKPVTTSYTDIPLPPAKDGLPAPKDDADIQAARSVPQNSFSATGLHPTAPRVSAPVQGSMAGSTPSSGVANSKDMTNAATASSPTSPKEPDVFSSNKHDKPAVSAGEKKAEYKTDLPAQHETKNTNHKTVPMPVITSIGNNTKDRTQPSLADNASKEVSSNPAASTHQAKAEAQAGMNNDAEGMPSRSYAKQPTDNTAVTGLPLATTQKPVTELTASPGTPVKPVVVAPASAPQTPASRLVASEVQASPASATTVSSTPGAKDGAADSTKKRKSGFLSKVKGVFNKDKAAK